MNRKVLLFLMVICPIFISADVQKVSPFQPITNIGSRPLTLFKGDEEHFSHTEKMLVHRLWYMFKNQRTAKKLQKSLTKDFQYLDVNANLLDKKDFIKALLQAPRILAYKIKAIKLTRHDDIIIAYYLLYLKTPSTAGSFFPLAQMNVFQKHHDRWKVKSYGDLDVFGMSQ